MRTTSQLKLNQYGINYDIVKEELDIIKSNFKSEAPSNPSEDDPYAKDDEGGSGGSGMGGKNLPIPNQNSCVRQFLVVT